MILSDNIRRAPDGRLCFAGYSVPELAKQYGLDIPDGELCLKAEQFALARGGRSPRAAKQLVEFLVGTETKKEG